MGFVFPNIHKQLLYIGPIPGFLLSIFLSTLVDEGKRGESGSKNCEAFLVCSSKAGSGKNSIGDPLSTYCLPRLTVMWHSPC